jgi:YkgG family uncharacterized protein
MKELIPALKSRNIEGYLVENKEQALDKALSLIPEGSTIGYGGSVTLGEIGIFDKLSGCTVFDKKDPEFHQKSLLSDVFLSSTNALTEEGKIVNVDGRSNRVAAITFGPKKVIIVVGKNKIVKNVDSALDRIRNVCIPKNLERLRSMGKGDWTADNMWCTVSIIERQRDKDRIHVIIVNEELGY